MMNEADLEALRALAHRVNDTVPAPEAARAWLASVDELAVFSFKAAETIEALVKQNRELATGVSVAENRIKESDCGELAAALGVDSAPWPRLLAMVCPAKLQALGVGTEVDHVLPSCSKGGTITGVGYMVRWPSGTHGWEPREAVRPAAPPKGLEGPPRVRDTVEHVEDRTEPPRRGTVIHAEGSRAYVSWPQNEGWFDTWTLRIVSRPEPKLSEEAKERILDAVIATAADDREALERAQAEIEKDTRGIDVTAKNSDAAEVGSVRRLADAVKLLLKRELGR